MVQGDAAFRTNTSSNFLGSWQDSTDLSSRPRLLIDLNHIFTCSGSVTVCSYRPVNISALKLFCNWGVHFPYCTRAKLRSQRHRVLVSSAPIGRGRRPSSCQPIREPAFRVQNLHVTSGPVLQYDNGLFDWRFFSKYRSVVESRNLHVTFGLKKRPVCFPLWAC
jgi:hypothetical protein